MTKPTREELQERTKKVVLPKLDELRIVAKYEENSFMALLNQEPLKEWIKPHPIASKKVNGVETPVLYIPIEIQEWLMNRIFLLWRKEVIEIKQTANSVICHLRLHYLHPITNDWDYTDGIGACPLQVNKDANPMDSTQIKANSVMLAAPSAKSYAFKDACEDLGKMFGRDLNRNSDMDYGALYAEPSSQHEQLTKKLDNCQSTDDVDLLYESLSPALKKDVEINRMFQNRKADLS